MRTAILSGSAFSDDHAPGVKSHVKGSGGCAWKKTINEKCDMREKKQMKMRNDNNTYISVCHVRKISDRGSVREALSRDVLRGVDGANRGYVVSSSPSN